MRAFQSDSSVRKSGLTTWVLEARLSREKFARLQAESLLEEKSRELYLANSTLQAVADTVESQRVQLDTIFNHTLTGVALANGELQVTRANRKAIALFDLGEAYFAELSIPDLFEDYVSVRSVYEDRVNGGNQSDDRLHEAVGKRADGTNFPMEFGLTSMQIEGMQHSVWVFRDVSIRKREESKRKALEHDLSQAQKMEALGTLASGVAHEINTPIQYISDNLRFMKDSSSDLFEFIELCQKITDDLKATDEADVIQSALKNKASDIDLEFLRDEIPPSISQSLEGIKQVASIVNAIKEFSHPGEDETSQFDLNQLITTTLTVTRNQWKYVADVETDLAQDMPLIQGLPGEISQVILNLVVNAADAIEAAQHGSNGVIAIRTQHLTDHAVLTISDNGSGIPDDVQDKIFDPFFTTKGVGKGTGQGLAIAYTIIRQKHNGTITCSSEPGKGTTFEIHLPISQGDADGSVS